MAVISECQFCKSRNLQPVLAINDNTGIYKCNACLLVQTIPMPDARYYDNAGYLETYIDHQKLFISLLKPFVKFTHKVKSSGRLLDIGCSTGIIMQEAIRLGYDVDGIELNAKAADHCLSMGLNVHKSDLLRCNFPDNSFDVVTMSHVLEHIADLDAFLLELSRIIKKSGYLVLSQPLYDALIVKVLKNKWYGWVPEEHIWHFSPKSIDALLVKYNFAVRMIDINGMYYPITFCAKALLTGIIARVATKLGCGDQFYLAAQKCN